MGILNKITDNFKGGAMACRPNMKVSTFIERFKNEFDLGVRVYVKNSNSPAKLTQTLAAIKSDDFKGHGEEIDFKMSHKVGDVEDMFKKKMGVKIQIEDRSGNIAGIDHKTLGELKRSE